MSALFENSQILQSLATLAPGANLSYYVIPRPELESLTDFWKPDTFIGTNDVIPGLGSVNVKTLTSQTPATVNISRITISIAPELNSFEEILLANVRDSFFEDYPELITFDIDGNPSSPTVVERRLQFGFHNTFGFIGAPTIVTLVAIVMNTNKERFD